MDAHQQVGELMDRIFWDPRASEADLIAEANKVVPIAHLLDPYTATDLNNSLKQLTGGGDVGSQIVQAWISAFRKQNGEHGSNDNDAIYRRPLHADIKTEFAAIHARTQAKTTVFDACMHIIKYSGWGTMQEVAMRSATVEDFVSTIKGLGMDDFRSFMRRMIEMRIQQDHYKNHFGSATDRFVEACTNIVEDSESVRLGTLIRRLFNDASIGGELVPHVSQDASSMPQVR